MEFGGDGQPVRMRGCSLDITRRKQAELEAAHQRKDLAHLSRVTTAGELSGSIAHELTQPLSAILSNAQAAQRVLASGDADIAELRQILNEIVSEDKRASEVIRRLRLWLKKGEVQQHSLRINKVVRDVMNLIRSDLINQKVTVECKLARNLPMVTGDPVQLQQVLLNLVLNACDAMTGCNTSERRLLIRTGIENDGGSVIVSVTDQGTGITEEKMENIFEPFFTTKPKGMGLGLSVCRSIITAHRGKLCATNNTDRGATFYFSVPVEVSPVATPLPATPKVAAATEGGVNDCRTQSTVFVVDDYAPVRRATSRLLHAAGFVVAAFASAEEFLAQYNPQSLGCLVLDLAMPTLNGLELQRILAKTGSLLPIIFLTGEGDIPKSVQAMKQGASDFLTKPVNDEDLLAAVRVAIEKNRALRRDHAELSEIRARLATLTPREREVLEYVVAGKLNKQIADELGTVEQTVKVHRAHVMQKMKVHSVAELVGLTQRCGIGGSSR